ncbi:hypothetical protein Tco_0262988, partial [Tanacetum coccineum]
LRSQSSRRKLHLSSNILKHIRRESQRSKDNKGRTPQREQRQQRKSLSKKKRVQQESVSKQGRKNAEGDSKAKENAQSEGRSKEMMDGILEIEKEEELETEMKA